MLRRFTDFTFRERGFLVLVGVLFLIAGMVWDRPSIAMWFAFMVAGYSVVANDSIQTIGTFIASNRRRPWWALWLYIGMIFLVTVLYSWLVNDGDVSYQRLAAKGFEKAPTSFSFLQVAAPIFLLIITRLRMPVSTTFLLLSSFASDASGVTNVLTKSVCGYFVAFGTAFGSWWVLSPHLKRMFKGRASFGWDIAQWLTSGFLWSIWIMQDAANVAVFLPRSLQPLEFAAFSLVIFAGLGVMFYMGGERIQAVVDEKSEVEDVRSATVIDGVYLLILFLFTVVSKVPMSTTWVFIGLLAGREIAMKLRGATDLRWVTVRAMVGRDLLSVTIGLVISLIIAVWVNDAVRTGLLGN